MNWTIRQKIDLQARHKQHYTMDDVLLIPGNNEGHVWEIEVLDGGEPAVLTGYTCKGQFMRGDGSVVTVSNGTISGNVASIKFASGCYVIPGQLRAVMTLTKDSKPVSICETYFLVRETLNGNGAIIIPSDEIVYTPTRQIVYEDRKFMDVSDTTAVPWNVMVGKYFYDSEGEKQQGTFPDISDTTASTDDVREGKVFYDANGVKQTGVGDYAVTFGGTVNVVLVSDEDYRFEFS